MESKNAIIVTQKVACLFLCRKVACRQWNFRRYVINNITVFELASIHLIRIYQIYAL